jgi:hypothetical protein
MTVVTVVTVFCRANQNNQIGEAHRDPIRAMGLETPAADDAAKPLCR